MKDWVVIVDDDSVNLEMASYILSEDGVKVTGLDSGQEFLDFIIKEGNAPDICLLDIKMPGMDGFETFEKLRATERPGHEIPVIFLTADDSLGAETKGLSLGAMDFIKKPFVPEILKLRVRHSIDLIRLQRNLSHIVAIKTEENQKLFVHVVSALAAAIDAKDAYTNGHSGRVASYAKEIARRYGYTDKQQDEIYMMALLHDVGKIGIPDAIINKPQRLTPEEVAIVKNHPVMGAKILESIDEMPSLSIGARWHHEKYFGGGYPDGLVGEEIPEQARIISVADAYDAMASRRSYRAELPQNIVREEILKGLGTHFDPKFADIMLTMIDEDKDYLMRE